MDTSTQLDALREISCSTMMDLEKLSAWTAAISSVMPPQLFEDVEPKAVLRTFHEQLYEKEWKDTTVAASVHLAYTVGLRALVVRGTSTVERSEMLVADMDDEKVTTAIDLMALQFIRDYLIRVPEFSMHFAFPHVIDNIIKALITGYPEKLSELLRITDQQLDYVSEHGPDNVPADFSFHYRTLMEIMTSIYSMDTPEMTEAANRFFASEYPSLHNFLANGRQIENPILFVTYLNMMTSICKTETSALTIYYFFKQKTGPEGRTWHHIFGALRKYFNVYQNECPRNDDNSKFLMPQAELTGFLAWIKLAERIAILSPECRTLFLEERDTLGTLIAIVAYPIHSYLKGTILRLLAAFALEDSFVNQIWYGMMRCGLVTSDSEGSLNGIPKDLDLECVSGRYETTRGLLKLLENLFWHPNAPVVSDLGPYVSFVLKSVLCGVFYRTYQNPQEMWNVLSSAFTVLYNIINNRTIDFQSFVEGQLHTVVLLQMLTGSGLIDAIKCTLYEGSRHIDTSGDPLPEREAATVAALRLLHKAVLRHGLLKEALRQADSGIKVSALDEIFLSPSVLNVPSEAVCRLSSDLLSLICPFVSVQPELLVHTNYALDILQKLTSLDSSKHCQLKYRSALEPHAAKLTQLAQDCSQLTSLESADFEWELGQSTTALDFMTMKPSELRGLAFCSITDIISHGLESCPQGRSLASLLLGCDDLGNLEETAKSSCMKGIIAVIVHCMEDGHPWSSPYVGLLERSLRVLDRLVAPRTSFSAASLGYLRTYHDLIFKLTSFILDVSENEVDVNHADIPIVHGTILNLTAVEISSLIMHGQYSQSNRIFHFLLNGAAEQDNDADNSVLSPRSSETCPLWRSFFDIAVRFNNDEHAQLEQSAYIQLLAGQLALVNVVSLFADVGCYDRRCLLYSLSDGIVNTILVFVDDLELSEAVTEMITNCLFRIVQTISNLCTHYGEELPDAQVHSDCFAVLEALVKYFVNPGSFFSVRGKIDMYGCIFQMLHTSKKLQSLIDRQQEVQESDPTMTFLEMQSAVPKNSPLHRLSSQNGVHLAQRFNSDVFSSVFALKLISVSCLVEFMRDDCEGTQCIIDYLVRSGSIRLLLESVCTPNLLESAKVEEVEKISMYFKAVMALFARIALTPVGKQALVELGAPKRLSQATRLSRQKALEIQQKFAPNLEKHLMQPEQGVAFKSAARFLVDVLVKNTVEGQLPC